MTIYQCNPLTHGLPKIENNTLMVTDFATEKDFMAKKCLTPNMSLWLNIFIYLVDIHL